MQEIVVEREYMEFDVVIVAPAPQAFPPLAG